MKVSALFNGTQPCEDADRPQAATRDARRCKGTFFENYTKNTGNAWIVRL